jgi:hypothetical protein
MRHPPGDEIYRDGTVSVWEVDGRKNKVRITLYTLQSAYTDFMHLLPDLLPKPLLAGKDVPRPQDAIL